MLCNNLQSQSSIIKICTSSRPITLKVCNAPAPKCEGYDEKNMKIGRPMSLHLTIYKPQLTAMLSISHRGTGNVN